MTDLDKRLSSTLKGMGDAHVEAVGAEIPRMRSDVLTRVRRRKVVRGVASFAVAAAVVSAAVLAWPEGGFDRAEPAPPIGPGPGRAVTEYIALGNFPDLAHHIASTDAGIYVAGNDYLHHIDPTTNKVETLYEHPRYETGQEHCCMDLSGFGGHLWRVVTVGSNPGAMIQAVDLETGEAKMSQAGSVAAGGSEGPVVGREKLIAVGSDFGWSVDPADRTVHMMDLESLSTIDGYEYDGAPRELAAWNEYVYVVGSSHSSVHGDDRDSIARYEAGGDTEIRMGEWPAGCLSAVSAGAEGVFLIDNCELRLQWLGPDLQTVAFAELPTEGFEVATGLGSVWVVHGMDTVSRFLISESEGQSSLEFMERVDVGDGPSDIVAGAGAMWVTNSNESSVTRIALDYGSQDPTPEPGPTENEEVTKKDRENFGAIYPASNFDDAVSTCDTPAWQHSVRRPEGVISAFVLEKLDWRDPIAEPRDDLTTEFSEVFEVHGAEFPEDRVLIATYEFMTDCWVVSSVMPIGNDGKPDFSAVRGLDRKGNRVTVEFDRIGAYEVIPQLGHDDRFVNGLALGDDVTSTEFTLFEWPPNYPGYWLILWRAPQNRVFTAAGGPLPAGYDQY